MRKILVSLSVLSMTASAEPYLMLKDFDYYDDADYEYVDMRGVIRRPDLGIVIPVTVQYDGSDESENSEENPTRTVMPGDDEPANWLIKNSCKLNFVNVDSGGTRTWKLRCPDSRWVTLVDTNLQ